MQLSPLKNKTNKKTPQKQETNKKPKQIKRNHRTQLMQRSDLYQFSGHRDVVRKTEQSKKNPCLLLLWCMKKQHFLVRTSVNEDANPDCSVLKLFFVRLSFGFLHSWNTEIGVVLFFLSCSGKLFYFKWCQIYFWVVFFFFPPIWAWVLRTQGRNALLCVSCMKLWWENAKFFCLKVYKFSMKEESLFL